jgi:hypothetical protein
MLGLSFVIPLPLFLYYANIYRVNEVFRAWSEQAVTSSPPWPHYLIAFAPLLLLALLPVIRRGKEQDYWKNNSFLWAWIAAAALLVYAPLNPQRRFVQGVQAPLSILAAYGLMSAALPRLAKTRLYRRIAAHPRYTDEGLRRLIVTGVLVFMAISNIYILMDVSLTAAMRRPYPFFRPQSELEGVSWLRENAERDTVVLAAYETGNYIAAHAGNRVVLGHWAETVNWNMKYNQVSKFFDISTDNTWRSVFLKVHNVKYVWFGPLERTLGDFDPSGADYLSPAFQFADTYVFEVR